mmetsp:Transcript_34056/g.42962  ORF Transcript_34056/g.42962 Transcript_34056/m.42962 type:complete len:408 (+) Transcript_34056:3-1226(+)
MPRPPQNFATYGILSKILLIALTFSSHIILSTSFANHGVQVTKITEHMSNCVVSQQKRNAVKMSSIEYGLTIQTVGNPTLTNHLLESGVSADLTLVLAAVSSACQELSGCIRTAAIQSITGSSGGTNKGGDAQKKLDVVANDILKVALAGCGGRVGVLASEEEDEPVVLAEGAGKFCLVFDPLDGSSNIDASIPTGTIFGIYNTLEGKDGETAESTALRSVLQPGKNLVASGYCLYSAQTVLVLSWGQGTHGYTLDNLKGDFVLSHPNMKIPSRGRSYSLNEARFNDWPEGLKKYIGDMKTGKGQSGKEYDLVYICSLVGDVHYTYFRGGMACNPRSHLRLVYEGNPMGFVVEQAGGLASTGVDRVLDVTPKQVHQRIPIFLGSEQDILELESYGDVQQLGNKKYDV